MLVFLQKRILPSACGTVMESLRTSLTRKLVPLKAFSGRPPSAGGLDGEFRHMPVQMGGSPGSMALVANVSLYQTSVGNGVLVPSILDAQRAIQKSIVPLKQGNFTPAA